MIAAGPSTDVTPLRPFERMRSGSPPSDAARSDRDLHLERSKGLCLTCDLRFECAFPVPDGGVWHCEEYA